jgi:hypothetical protein
LPFEQVAEVSTVTLESVDGRILSEKAGCLAIAALLPASLVALSLLS